MAIVHDWFVTPAGSEQVVEQLIALFPQADVFSLLDFLPRSERKLLAGKPVTTSFLQRMPLARRCYTAYLPLMPLAIEQLNVAPYDLVISSSHCVAKGVLTGPDQVHVSYTHTPMRYAWDAQHEYLSGTRLGRGPAGWFTRWMLHKLRIWDARTAAGVDSFVANSRFVARRIWKTYRRAAQVVYPPVDVGSFSLGPRRDDFYVTASRLVPYKRVDLLVDAFGRMPHKRLIVIGDGPQLERLRARATRNVTLLGRVESGVLRDHVQRARAFLFAAREDFGIAPVEAQACGTPVIAFGAGGAVETIRGLDAPQPTGVFFGEQTPDAVINAVAEFERCEHRIRPAECRAAAEQFGIERFRHEMFEHVSHAWQQFSGQALAAPALLPPASAGDSGVEPPARVRAA